MGPTASYGAGGPWMTGGINLQVASGALAPVGSGEAALLARRLSGDPSANDDIFFARWTKSGGFELPQALTQQKALGLSAAPHGAATMLVYLGTDNKHYWATAAVGALGPAQPLPAGSAAIQAFGPSAPAVTAHPGDGVYAAYVGDDGNIYWLDKPGVASPWGTSTLLSGASAASKTLPPALLGDDMLHVFHVRSGDGRVCHNRVQSGAPLGEELLPSGVTAVNSPSAARVANGDIVIAFKGSSGVHFLRGQTGSWGAPVTIDTGSMPLGAPVVAPGLSGADAEIVYLQGGKLQHVRVTGTTFTSAAVNNVVSNVSLAAVVVP